jgi:hypothetical protein
MQQQLHFSTMGWLAATALSLLGGLAPHPLPAANPDRDNGLHIAPTTPEGTLLVRREGSPGWAVLKSQLTPTSKDSLMALPGERAVLETHSRPIRLELWGNVPELSPFPVLESMVSLHTEAKLALDVTLERGRIILINGQSKSEPAWVQVRFLDKTLKLGLSGGAEVGLELYSRWAPGTPFTKEPRPGNVPTVAFVVWVLKGQTDFQAEGEQFSLQAPPGPAYIHWTNFSGWDRSPERRDNAPPWAGAKSGSAQTEAVERAVATQRRRIASGPDVASALREGAIGSDAALRTLAIYGLAAISDLAGVCDALADAKHADARQAAVRALRHWIGRGHSQDLALYDFLIKQGGYTAAQADTLLQLLHGLSDEHDRNRPESYETLIAYLRHPKLAVRQLAIMQLLSWVPQGQSISYDPAGTEVERERRYQAWRKLIPAGVVPARPTKPRATVPRG